MKVSCIFGPLNGAVVNGFTIGPCGNQFGGATNGFNNSGHRSGWLLGYYWFGSVFLVNVPFILLALVGGWFLVPKSRDPEGKTVPRPE